MRHAMAIVVLALGLSAAVPAAFANDRDGRDLSLPAVSAQTELSDVGTTAGPTMNQNQFDDRAHDRS